MSTPQEIISLFPSAEQMNSLIAVQTMIANKMGAYEVPLIWLGIQAGVRSGIIRRFLDTGDQLKADTAEVVSAAVSGEGITAATVNKDTFLAAAGTHQHEYEFEYDGAAWHFGGHAVALTDYGISVTGTAVSGDIVVIHRSATTYDCDVQGIDEDEPVDTSRKHVLAIQFHKIFRQLNFDPPQYLVAVTAEALTAWGISGNVLPAGTYNVTLDHAAYNGSTSQDCTVQFTTTVDIPIGGGIRHTAIGAYQSSSYTKAQILSGTFVTYAADTVTTLETGLVTTEGNDGINLGTTTASTPSYKIGDFINFSQRQAYGTNRWSKCYARLYLNSRDATVQFVRQTIFSRNVASPPEGFLHTLDPELVAVLGKVRKRYALCVADGYGYEDVEDYVTLNTFTDMGGGANNSIYEGPVNAAGTVTRTGAYSLWKGTTNADRIKYLGSSAAYWWLSSCGPSGACYVRYVYTSGAFSSYAYYSYGLAPSLYII